MSIRDDIGFNFEMNNLQVLKDNGFNKYVTFHNPTDMWKWKRHIGLGVDMVVQIGEVTYDIEESYCAHDYSYRARWFYQSRLPRFRDVPDEHQKAILTNREANFSSIQYLLERYNILLLTVTTLLSLLSNVDTTTTRTIPHNYNYITCMPMEKRVVEEYSIYDVRNPNHELWMSRELERLEKLGNGS